MSLILFLGLVVLGAMISLLGGIIITAQAFRESLVWGLLYLFVPFASLVFINKFWKQREWVRISSSMVFGGGLLVFLGTLFAPSSSTEYAATDADFSDLQQELYTETQAISTIASSASAPTDNPFRNAVNLATQASNKTQTASTKDEWHAVATTWQDAIALLNAVPQSDANYDIAQTKVDEYSKNLAYAQQNAQ